MSIRRLASRGGRRKNKGSERVSAENGAEARGQARKKGKLLISHRYNRIPLLNSLPGGFYRSWSYKTYPSAKVTFFSESANLIREIHRKKIGTAPCGFARSAYRPKRNRPRVQFRSARRRGYLRRRASPLRPPGTAAVFSCGERCRPPAETHSALDRNIFGGALSCEAPRRR